MTRIFGSRGASAVMGFFMLTLASAAPAQTSEPAIAQAVEAAKVDTAGKPALAPAVETAKVETAAKPAVAPAVEAAKLEAAAKPATIPATVTTAAPVSNQPAAPVYARPAYARPMSARPTSAPAVATVVREAVTSAASAVTSAVGNALGFAVRPKFIARPDIAREVAWLHRSGWPLYALVHRYANHASAPPLDEQANCIAVAVYHEARGESLEGQLAVARVIMNRAASGKYPPTWCETVKQPWQFSFVRNYQFPYTDTNCEAWRKAVAITRLATSNAIPILSKDVLWYHADYVAPSWGRRLTRVNKIGTHIFYRA